VKFIISLVVKLVFLGFFLTKLGYLFWRPYHYDVNFMVSQQNIHFTFSLPPNLSTGLQCLIVENMSDLTFLSPWISLCLSKINIKL